MTKRIHVGLLIAALMPVLSNALLAQASRHTPDAASGSSWTHPKTPWGDPDIQGIWPSANIAGTPFERAADLGERATLTDEEFKKRQQEFAAEEARVRGSIVAGSRVASPDDGETGGGPAHWGERWLRTPNRRTSLIVPAQKRPWRSQRCPRVRAPRSSVSPPRVDVRRFRVSCRRVAGVLLPRLIATGPPPNQDDATTAAGAAVS